MTASKSPIGSANLQRERTPLKEVSPYPTLTGSKATMLGVEVTASKSPIGSANHQRKMRR
ncbi:hypothetical protein ACN6MY_22140 [Peribacillus sp. B-H-3]|uniref:hypothetical protein n=1 Tax=Peribacillus sp. B-H-3 TaxID=3400420 RepID=UPI003B01AE91